MKVIEHIWADRRETETSVIAIANQNEDKYHRSIVNSIQIKTKTSMLSELAVNTNNNVANDLSFIQLVGR